MRGADDLSAGALRRASLEGAMSGLTPAPTKRVHDPSGVATHGEALWSAGDSPFRSARVLLCLYHVLRLIPLRPGLAHAPGVPERIIRPPRPGGRASGLASGPIHSDDSQVVNVTGTDRRPLAVHPRPLHTQKHARRQPR
jgi:hypothetical protein